MSSFSGEYDCKVDAKGRMVFPSKFKAKLPDASGKEIILFRGFEKCIDIYTTTEFKKFSSIVKGLDPFNPEHRKFQRNFLRRVTEVELDGTGRILFPKSFLEYAQIEKDVVALGMMNKIELWAKEVYENDTDFIEDSSEFSLMAQKILSDTNE